LSFLISPIAHQKYESRGGVLKSSIRFIFFLFCLHLVPNLHLATHVYADQNQSLVELDPLVIRSSPGGILADDPIVPGWSGEIGVSGAGSIQNSLQNQMSFAISDFGKRGMFSQIRGLGTSSDDIDIQVFGISMNPAQGGGFDLTAFPQFLWSNYQFQLGPSLNALNRTAASGTLSLTPWTSKALKEPGWGARGSSFYSSSGTSQVAAAAKDGENFAVVAGYSSMKAIGPSAVMSGRWGQDQYSGALHLLATDLDMETEGDESMPSPQARARKTRVIPVLQNDFRLSSASFLKTSVFYDWGFVGYQNPDTQSQSQSKTHIQQWGTENAYLLDQWKFGLSIRQVSYQSSSSWLGNIQDSQVPLQNLSTLQVSRVIEAGEVILEPTVQGVWVTQYGWMPQGSLGVRKEWGRGAPALFSRASYSKKIPTLLDRYSVYSEFSGNPNLQPETDWTGVLGGEVKDRGYEASLQGYAQFRQDARVFTGSSVNNMNHASVFALTGAGRVEITSWLDGIHSTTLSRSRLYVTDDEFPFAPAFLSSTGISLHKNKGRRAWEWTTSVRGSSSQINLVALNGSSRAGGYAVLDTGAQVELMQGLRLGGRVENVMGRSIELIKGYPLGRSVALMLSGEI
jgi:hypothetical protein